MTEEEFDALNDIPRIRQLILELRTTQPDTTLCNMAADALEELTETDKDNLTAEDAAYLLGVLTKLVDSIEQNVDGDHNDHVHPDLWDDYGIAIDTLRDYGAYPPRQF